MAGGEEGGKLVTDAHESKSQILCFEIVPVPLPTEAFQH